MTTSVSSDSGLTQDRLTAVKVRQQAMWASGDYSVIGATLQIVGEALNEAADVRSIHKVLDVAAGSGNATLAAARRFASVTSTDYVPELLEHGRRRADAERFRNVIFEVADVEALPYADASFDVVLSTFGVMFAPDHERSAAEMTRVCKAGGTIGLANWTPAGFIGRLLRTISEYVPPAAGVRSPLMWGTEAHIRELFPAAAHIEHTKRMFVFRYRSPEHWLEVFRTFYGPVFKAFMTLDAERQDALAADIMTLLQTSDRGKGAGLVIDGEYLETVITK